MMDYLLFAKSQDQVLRNHIDAQDAIKLFLWQRHTPLHGKTAMKMGVDTGTTRAGRRKITADQIQNVHVTLRDFNS